MTRLVGQFWVFPDGTRVFAISGGGGGEETTTIQQALADKNEHFEILGTNGTSALATFSASGGITLTTAGASADQMILLPHLNTGASAWTGTTWATSKELTWRIMIATAASIADTTIWAGLKLTNTSVTATDNEQVFFRYGSGTNSGKWQFVYSIGGVDVALDTGITVVLSTYYEFEISLDALRVPTGLVGVANAPVDKLELGTAALASGNLIPYAGVQADAAAAKAIDVKWVEMSRAF